jgi:hypothetical protein
MIQSETLPIDVLSFLLPSRDNLLVVDFAIPFRLVGNLVNEKQHASLANRKNLMSPTHHGRQILDVIAILGVVPCVVGKTETRELAACQQWPKEAIETDTP